MIKFLKLLQNQRRDAQSAIPLIGGERKTRACQNVTLEEEWDNSRKSPLMVECFLLLWVLSLIFYGPRLWQVIATSRNIMEATLLATFCAMLFVFWLLFAYYVAVVLFSFFSGSLPPPSGAPEGWCPNVAVLYPTRNDFQVEAATSCLNQDYPNFHLFLLDDSTEDKFRAMVDAFHTTYPERTTVVRRPTRHGFKAGNLNHALRGVAVGYPFFTVVDADERLPSDFLQRTMAYMWDSRLAFVQANHAPNPMQDSAFARDIASTILPFWHVHCRPRNRYGLVLYLGHGAVVRWNAWKAVGGFPEVVLEDLAFSVALVEKGMRGMFLENVLCYEDFPSSYPAFKRQHERYIIGTTQVMHRHLGALLRSRQASLTEKIDFCLWCSPLYVPALCLVFAGLCSLGLAGIFGLWGSLTLSIFERQFVLPAVRILDERFAPLWSWDFQLFSTLSSFSPAFACLALGLKRKLRAIKLLFLSTLPYLSVMFVSWRGILGYLLLGRTFSPPTGEEISRFGNWSTPRVWEACVGSLLSVISLMSFNVGLFAVCCCLLMGIYIEVYGWEGRFVRLACIGCFSLILLQTFINMTLLIQSLGFVPLAFSLHF